MKEQIEQYSPPSPSVVALGHRRVRAYVADAPAAIGSTLWVGDVPTRVAVVAKNHRVEAIAFDTGAFAVGDAVRCAPQTAGWPAPRPGVTTLEALDFAPGRAAAPPVGPRRPAPLVTGIDAIDALLPLARHGVTMVLDTGAPDACVDRLLDALSGDLVCASARRVSRATHQLQSDEPLALAVATEWARELDAALLLESAPFDADVLLADCPVTAILRVQLRDGLDVLAETLDLGHCDTQIVLRPDGTIDLGRSASDLTPDTELAARIARVGALREHIAIFGAEDLDDADAALLEEAAALERWLA